VYNNTVHDSIGILPNEARYSITLATHQGIVGNPLRGEILHTKDRAEDLTKIREKLENS
jgi:hypothetical protein